MTTWPALMLRKTASAYLDMSEASFVREVEEGRMPAAIKVGGRPHWRRDAIDKAIDRLTGSADEPDYRRELRQRYGKAA